MTLLAHSQALLLYQIIRLFDGDIRQRSDAEPHKSILMGCIELFLTKCQQLPAISEVAGPSFSLDSLASWSWNDWIFHESCRRTILIAYMLHGVYSFLKVGWDNVSGKVDRLSFTAQHGLWNAPSEYHWKTVSKETKHLQVTINQWDIAMEDATPDDLEELGILILACLKGLDITRGWVGKQRLEMWGLTSQL